MSAPLRTESLYFISYNVRPLRFFFGERGGFCFPQVVVSSFTTRGYILFLRLTFLRFLRIIMDVKMDKYGRYLLWL